MKKTIIILTLISMLTGCHNRNKIPDRLLSFEINGEETHLLHISRIDYFGEEVIFFVTASGEWSKWSENFAKCKDCSFYGGDEYSLRFAQDNNRFKLEKVEGDITPSWGEPPRLQWQDVGYSTDNTLWAKIFEYYLKNKNTIQ